MQVNQALPHRLNGTPLVSSGRPEDVQPRLGRVQAGRRTLGAMSTERLIKWSTAAAVVCVATVAAVVSYNHAYALVQTYGEAGWTARLVPLTVDGLIYASSMVLL